MSVAIDGTASIGPLCASRGQELDRCDDRNRWSNSTSSDRSSSSIQRAESLMKRLSSAAAEIHSDLQRMHAESSQDAQERNANEHGAHRVQGSSRTGRLNTRQTSGSSRYDPSIRMAPAAVQVASSAKRLQPSPAFRQPNELGNSWSPSRSESQRDEAPDSSPRKRHAASTMLNFQPSSDILQTERQVRQRNASTNDGQGSTLNTRISQRRDDHAEPEPRPRERAGSFSKRKHSDERRRHKTPSQKVMLSKALQKANDAVVLDNAQNFVDAVEAYGEACDLLLQVMNSSSGDEEKIKLDTIVWHC